MGERPARLIRGGLGVAGEHRDFERGSGLERLAASDGEHTPAIRRRNAPVRLGNVQSSGLRTTKSLIAELRIANLSTANNAQNLESQAISIQTMVREVDSLVGHAL